jgi:hypothetical protein
MDHAYKFLETHSERVELVGDIYMEALFPHVINRGSLSTKFIF